MMVNTASFEAGLSSTTLRTFEGDTSYCMKVTHPIALEAYYKGMKLQPICMLILEFCFTCMYILNAKLCLMGVLHVSGHYNFILG